MQLKRTLFKENTILDFVNTIKYILKTYKIDLRDIENIVYYEKPLLTFERLLETYIASSPRGMRSFIAAMQVWIKEKIISKITNQKTI